MTRIPTLVVMANPPALAGGCSVMKGKITLKGYTDSIGSENYNINLSAERVVRVKEFLVETGIRSEMIEAKSFGECCFVAANENDESRALNRRVEIYIEQSRLE